MMRMIEQKTYRAMFSSEDKEKNREVIKYLEDLAQTLLPYLFEIEHNDHLEKCGMCDITKIISLLKGLEKNNFKIIPYEWQE